MTDFDQRPRDRTAGTTRPTPRATSGSSYSVQRFGAVAAVILLVGGLAWFFTLRGDDEEAPGAADDTDSSPVPPTERLALHGWAPYWALEHSIEQLELRAENFTEISPFWFQASGVDVIERDPHVRPERARRFIQTAREHGVPLVPSILDVLPAGEMAAILADPETRTRHVDAIVRFARRGDFDGIDIDYEQFAFADGRDSWDETRPNWVAFIEELSEKLHADGRTLTVSIPPVFSEDCSYADSGLVFIDYTVYDYEAITPLVDSIRVMAYDYSTSEAGPIAPLEWVRCAVDGTAAASGDPSKLVLGLPLYGYNWPVADTGGCPSNASGRTGVSIRSLTELLSRRSAVPEWDEELAEYSFEYQLTVEGEDDDTRSCVQTRRVHYVDAYGAQLRLDLAREAGFGGVSLWAFGYEDGSVWNRITPSLVIQDHEPEPGPASGTTDAPGDGDRQNRQNQQNQGRGANQNGNGRGRQDTQSDD